MSVKDEIALTISQHCAIIKNQLKYLDGSKIKILSNYNGQPHGSSKKSLKGTIQTIRYAFVDMGEIWIFIEGDHQAGLAYDEWELIIN